MRERRLAFPFSFGGRAMGQLFFRESAVGGVLQEVCALATKKAGSKRVGIVKKPAHGESEEAIEMAGGTLLTPPGPPVKDGEHFIKTELLKELSAITNKMIESAKNGGTAPLRLLWQLGKLHEDATLKPRRRSPSLGKLLMDEIRNKEALAKQAGKQPGK
jgi:hypothetical protein